MYGFIVEGLHDKDLLEQNYENVQALHCEGTRLNNRVKGGIEVLKATCSEVFIFTDPDHQGRLFAKQLNEQGYNFRQLHLEPFKCCVKRGSKVKYGIEHASLDYLEQALRDQGVFLLKKSVTH